MGFAVEIANVSRRYPAPGGLHVVALNDVYLEIEAGSAVTVAGPSGSGKSTLLHLIGAMDRPDTGMISVDGRDISRLSRAEQSVYRRTIGFVFQRFHLLSALTVLDNVIAPILPYRSQVNKEEEGRRVLAAVGLRDKERSAPSRLSGGEQQRVAIARALINRPGLLLADEPTGNLDSDTGSEIIRLLLELREHYGMTIAIASHDPLVAASSDRIVRLKDGTICDDVAVSKAADTGEVLERISRFDPGS